jgi:hypothetical protein
MPFTYIFSIDFSPDFDGLINLVDDIPVSNVQEPEFGTVVISDISGISLTVTSVIRYNGSGRFTCGVTNADQSLSGIMDVYFDTIWKAKEYIPERYPDEEGVELKM